MNLSEPPAKIWLLEGRQVECTYAVMNSEMMESVVEKCFENYYYSIENSNSDSSLRATALLYQQLEWLHPFKDGQGRTDLILLSKLLVENGFNPAILHEPYFSTFQPFESWVAYLKKGIAKWKEELDQTTKS